MTNSQIRTIEEFFGMIAKPAQTAVLNAALRLGVMDALQEGQKTVSEIASQCSINESGTEAILQVLEESGMVERFQEHFALSQACRLTSRAFWAILFEQWTGLENAMRGQSSESDEPEYERNQLAQKRLQKFRAIHSQIQWAATGVALKVAEVLGIGSERKSLHILDLACGSAVYSMTIAHRDEGSIVKLVDDRNGLARARATVNSLDVASRVEWNESDEISMEGHNGSFDLVILADHIHLLDAETQQQAVETASRVLAPGGELAIVDVFPGQERGQMNRSLFELQLLTGTGRNPVRLKQLNAILANADFAKIRYAELPVAPWTHGLVLAAKP